MSHFHPPTPTRRLANQIGADDERVNQQAGYTLTDRATLLQLASALALRVVSEGDPHLLNTSAVIVNPDRPETSLAAMAFGRWLSDGSGRNRIGSYKTGGMHASHLWPLEGPRDRPTDVPDHDR